MVDETLIKVGNELVWVWIIAIELKDKTILGIRISYDERSILIIAEQFIQSLVRKYGKHLVSTDGDSTWYPQACKFLKLKHHIHLPYEKSIIERKNNNPIC